MSGKEGGIRTAANNGTKYWALGNRVMLATRQAHYR
jgi:hypothetical protein